MELYLHSVIYLHGVVLKSESNLSCYYFRVKTANYLLLDDVGGLF
jgi:hypothetical protein